MHIERVLQYARLAASVYEPIPRQQQFSRDRHRQVRWTHDNKAILFNYPDSKRQVLVVRGAITHPFSDVDASADTELVRDAASGIRFHRGHLKSARSLCEHLLRHPSMVKRGGGGT
eukprot:jgi/Mesvir1/20125/Mv13364-RA.1